MCETCGKLATKTLWRRYVFIANFEQISNTALVFALLALNK